MSARHAGRDPVYARDCSVFFAITLSFVPTQRRTEYAGSKYGGFRLEPMWFFGS